ncbi:PREDICTED: sequestosome-1 [Dinoponera quadriceps]|uniref:Sequestosome-1 n=1 Tax=Dinoponera quadriceps TaxID=609295 RepID=A0A6P3WN94_DINQU|nr:PREDICTED: sequestosome-1 [Dinoponera quadriceps]
MNNKLSFKVYLLNEELNKRKEVRRFCLDIGVARNFVCLREKLQAIFPELHEKNFTVTWKDDEDTIVISTSEELEIALDEMNKHEMVNKLYVVLQSEKGDMPNLRTDKKLHPGVICDVCENTIRGFRFKCMQCPDYDLCTSCMTIGYHPEHFMVRMTEPVEWSSYHGRRLAHHMRKFMKKASSGTTSHNDKDDETRRCSFKAGGGSGSSRRGGGCPGLNVTGGKVHFDPTYVNSLADFVKNVCLPSEESCYEQPKRSKEHQREPSTEAATEATEDTQQTNSFTQLLKLFEQNVSHISQFLDPLGINIVVTSDNENPTSKQPAAKTTTPPTTESGAPSQPDISAKFPGEGKKLRDDNLTESAMTAAKAAATSPMETENLAATTNDVSSSSSSSSSSTTSSPQVTQKVGFREQVVDEPEWTVVGHETPDISRAPSISSHGNGTVPKQSAPSAPPAKPEAESAPIYPPLPTAQEFYHRDPKIQHAVEAMMSMGFTNQGGWLTQLLVSKDGDIIKALDVLQPVRR